MELGLNVNVFPPPPEAAKVTAESKLPEMVVVIAKVPELPWATDNKTGEAETVSCARGGRGCDHTAW